MFIKFLAIWLIVSFLASLFMGLFMKTGKGPDRTRWSD
jgi:hypothetical protein